MDPGGRSLVESRVGTRAGSFVECGRCRTAELIRKGIRLFKDVTRDRAKGLTRAGQVGALTLATLAGVVLAVGLPGTAVPKLERAEAAEAPRITDSSPERERPAILERRGASIAANLKQLGNSPKEPPPIPAEAGDDTGDQALNTAPVSQAQETAIVFLGLLGSSARPMALVSIDSHQQVLAIGDVVRKGSGETIKLVGVGKNGIEIEAKGGTRKVELAPRTGAAYTTLQNSPSGASPGLVPGMAPPAPPPGAAMSRPRRENDMRAPGPRRQRFDEAGGARE